ncbi:MAG TPA: prepilin-type N-terminal cleavage/methylation domain-containing protein [Thermotogota bacterium]|nr:prepilin-type N-terminal cleavage/methylation domain-containing protein [Thermotogota bacterium]
MRRAFTIVELLIVLGIIALLTSVVIKVSADAVIHARAVQVAVNLTAIM